MTIPWQVLHSMRDSECKTISTFRNVLFLLNIFKGLSMTCLWSFRVHIMMGFIGKLPALFFHRLIFKSAFECNSVYSKLFLWPFCLSVPLSVKRCIVTERNNRLSVYQHHTISCSTISVLISPQRITALEQP